MAMKSMNYVKIQLMNQKAYNYAAVLLISKHLQWNILIGPAAQVIIFEENSTIVMPVHLKHSVR